MGNSNAKEARAEPDGAADGRRGDGRSRNRMSRADLTGFLSLQTASRDRQRQDAPFERRETRQEREARRLERERVSRAKERERSMREEHVDGGFLVTLGTYTGTEDFSKPVVRHLQIERRMAPFWRGLNDWSSSWAEHQLVAAARGLPVPPADAPPDADLVPRPPASTSTSPPALASLTVPMGARTLSAASDRSDPAVGPSLPSPATTSSAVRNVLKPRAKALAAALSVGSRNASSTDLTPKETFLPPDPFVNGQPIEVYLYKDAAECPICFLSYPPYLNRTRCCDQSICSECFVQIKRPDPHLPEHHSDGAARDPADALQAGDPPEMLISEPAACPYCQQPEFGVTYDPPPFRRGLVHAVASTSNIASSTAMSSQSSLSSTLPPASPRQGRRRTHSLSASAPNVVTTDRVRPDWSTKLAAVRAHQARRAAAATALHTAAFIVGGNEQRSMLRGSRFGRRTGPGSNGTGTPGHDQAGGSYGPESGEPSMDPDDARRTRMDELEEMMFMEAVRLSLATEEERKRKEEKALRKEIKKRQQAERKAQKKEAKGPYGGEVSGASRSSLSLGHGRRRGNSVSSNLRVEATVQAASQAPRDDAPPAADAESREGPADKGKGIDRGPLEPDPVPVSSAGSSVGSLLVATPTRRGSHLRQISNASSLGSSLADTPSGSYPGPGFGAPDGGGHARPDGRADEGDRDGSEPMFNFRSLAELVGVNIDDGSAHPAVVADGEEAVEGAKDLPSRPLSRVKEEAEAEHAHAAGGDDTSFGGSEDLSSTVILSPEATARSTAPGGGLSASHVPVNAVPPQLMLTPGSPEAGEGFMTADAKRPRGVDGPRRPSPSQ
ncbi:hypothetical protein DCS_03554 [Drechmeria coniospora]|uniref:C2H2 zinc finger protein n=1 Tax=Drechmeria coniospora TaxID=98403 RepID=A0A151GHH9_DRECN|nr:hypothetical protein DCS_03554 [Drechmeria coniospora]KYK56554.1 hypothetical protein DCS_03554 [Drechmeria coniospora]